MDPVLEFDRVTCDPPGIEPLRDLSFTVTAGRSVVFFGVEGSGISTLAPLVLGLEERFAGEIRFRGETLRDLDYLGRMRYRNRIGYLHGDYGLISNLSVAENISLRLEYYSELSPGEIRDLTERLMGELGIADVRDARPVRLSPSQILRTAYARAVAHDPDLLVIEHAFVNQSPLDVRSVMDVLARRTSDPAQSTVFITYEPQKFLDFAGDFCMINAGRAVFQGTREEFVASDNPYLVQYREVSLRGPMAIR